MNALKKPIRKVVTREVHNAIKAQEPLSEKVVEGLRSLTLEVVIPTLFKKEGLDEAENALLSWAATIYEPTNYATLTPAETSLLASQMGGTLGKLSRGTLTPEWVELQKTNFTMFQVTLQAANQFAELKEITDENAQQTAALTEQTTALAEQTDEHAQALAVLTAKVANLSVRSSTKRQGHKPQRERLCPDGKKCKKGTSCTWRHPSKKELSTVCKWGKECHTKNCIFIH